MPTQVLLTHIKVFFRVQAAQIVSIIYLNLIVVIIVFRENSLLHVFD